MIDLKASEAIVSDAFTDVSQSTLKEFLKRESLDVKEVDLFKAVVKWSEAECLRKGKEWSTENKLAAMGNAIHQIRFASMTLEEFGQNVSPSGLLTLAEVVLFYDMFSGKKRMSGVWNMSERGAKEEILLRCPRFRNYGNRFYSLNILTVKNELCVSFSSLVNLHGVRLLGSEGGKYDVKLEVFSQAIENKFLAQKNTRYISGFDVILPRPIKVQANVIVHLKVTIKSCFSSHCQAIQNTTAETNGVTVNFIQLSDIKPSLANLSLKDYLIDEIIFSKI